MTENIHRYDVAIVGAGPAGSTCALALGKSGLKVALIDKSTFPRDKICGDAVAAYVPKVLATIDPQLKKDLANFSEKWPVNTFKLVAANKVALDLQYASWGFISKRKAFDNFLYEQTLKYENISHYLNAKLVKVTVDNEETNLEFDSDLLIKAKIVIGCDGANGIVKKQLTSTKMDPRHHSAAVRGYYKNVSGLNSSVFELHYLKDLGPGYFWVFPLPNNEANVGFGMLSESTAAGKLNLREKLKEIIANEPQIKERFLNAEAIGPIEGYGLPLGSRKTQISGNRFMLAGDAAALIDPLTGEGIGEAIASGRFAGWQAIKCFKENNFSADFMKDYDQNVYSKFWKSHYKSYLVQRLISKRNWPLNFAVKLGNKSTLFKKLILKYA